MIEKNLDLDLRLLIQFSLELHPNVKSDDKLVDEIYDFIVSRLRAYYADKGISAEQFEAVRVCRPAHPIDFAQRIEAVKQFSQMDGSESLSAANKRISNILKKVDGAIAETVNPDLFTEDAETNLWNTLDSLRETVSQQIAGRDYIAAISELSTIREAVDTFFDDVMVMADDEAVKQNSLALLNQIYQLFLQVADISRL